MPRMHKKETEVFWLCYLQLTGSSVLLSNRSFSMFHSGKFCFVGVEFRLLTILFEIAMTADVSFCGCRTLRPKTFPLMWIWRFKFRGCDCPYGICIVSFDSDCNKTWTNQDLERSLWRSKGTLHAHAQHFQESQCIILQSRRELLQTQAAFNVRSTLAETAAFLFACSSCPDL